MSKQLVNQKRLYLDGSFTKVKALGDGVYEGIVATNSQDRHGETLDIEGLDTSAYMGTNPIVLFGHDYSNPQNVIGKALTLTKSKHPTQKDVNGKSLVQLSSQFQIFKDVNPTAGLVDKLIKKGVLALSIGFVPKEIDGDTYTKSEMAEYSVVPVPANAEAAITARSLGVTKKELHMVFKGAISTSLPLADKDTEWDSGEAIKRIKAWASDDEGNIDFTKYRKAFFWVDPDNADKQGGYKLPYADVIDGKLQAVWRAVAAVYAVLEGARGGVKDVDVDAVKAQVKKYYAKFDEDWPEDNKNKDTGVEPGFLDDEDSTPNEELEPGANDQNPANGEPANTVKAAKTTKKGAVTDEINEDLERQKKAELVRTACQVWWAFLDVYYSPDTKADQFEDLLGETISLLQKVQAGTLTIDDDDNVDVDDDEDGDEVLEYSVSQSLVKGVTTLRIKELGLLVTKADDDQTFWQGVLNSIADVDKIVDALQANIAAQLGVNNPDDDDKEKGGSGGAIINDEDGPNGTGEGQEVAPASNTVKELKLHVTENGIDISDLDAHNVKQLATALKQYAVELEEDAAKIAAASTTQGTGTPLVRKRKLVLKSAKQKVVTVDKLVELTLRQLK